MSGPSFHYIEATRLDDALAQGARHGATYVAGGTDFLQLWKTGLAAPKTVIDICRLPLAEISYAGDTLSLGALSRLSDVAAHPDVKIHHPLIADAILASASGQLRNMATLGGNLLQRTRCPYFRSAGLACNKRAPGSGCGARDGENRHAALFGTSSGCVATHASDLAVALAALDAEIVVASAAGERRLRLPDLYLLPAPTTAPDSSLADGDVITAISIHDACRFAPRSTYLKIRDRASFEFAVVSVAAALQIEDGVITAARLAAGGVAPLPWRLHGSEAALVGRAPGKAAFAAAGDLAIEGATPLAKNAFKIPLLRSAVIRALQTIGGVS
ncbi:FAD binding domain-containing protein [Bradyrhizobium sp.]|uniref:FAD binding domain-containing protein n=1 Tax=Bradyrhizobium sp. TaxID=376 RepID=UPI0025C04C9D|nr:FAD binding domain-containing protein [Bradyrhizobium sp.]MBV8918187.1 FAD binding domain-containing protein [Bradyrhizobium sp.]